MVNALLIVEVIILIGMSAICSGLNLSLMSLEVSDLKRRAKYGNKRAKLVLPLRENSHLSLASILLVNVAVVSATSLVLEHRFNGLIAGGVSTILIVIFGEIFPQDEPLKLPQNLRLTLGL
jgi:metal transporter CNNM